MPKITKRVVDALRSDPSGAEVFAWDNELRGFGVRLMPSGVASYLVQYRTSEGRTRRLVIGKVGTLTPDEARKLARDSLASARKGEDPSAERHAVRKAMTVSELCDRYLNDAEGRIKASTWAMDKSRIETHVKPLIGRLPVRALTAADIEGMKVDIMSGRTAKPWKREGRGGVTTGGRSVASRTVGMLGTILEFARHLRLIKENPARGVKKPTGGKQQRFLTLDEIALLGKSMHEAEATGESTTGLSAIRLLLMTGLRRMEALALPRAWVDARTRCIRFADTKSGAQLRPIGADAMKLLEVLPEREGCPWVFPAERGDGHYVGLPKVLKRVCAKVGLQGVTVHVLRHSFASVAAEMGFSELTIAGLLGHSVPGVTARYAHVPDAALAAAADRVCAQISTALDVKRDAMTGEIQFVERSPIPDWKQSRYWAAIQSLAFGKVELLADALERGEVIPLEAGEILATALRDGTGLPFRLKLIANPKPGAKRAGRWPENHFGRDIVLAEQMSKKMAAGNTYDDAADMVAKDCGVGDRTVKTAYSKYDNILGDYKSDFAVTLKSLEDRNDAPRDPPVARWMLNGDELEDDQFKAVRERFEKVAQETSSAKRLPRQKRPRRFLKMTKALHR
jgi:integrase